MTDQDVPAPVIFGEVLFDRFPDGRTVLGGAPFNVAWHLRALGVPPLLISRVGGDTLGEDIRRAMAQWRLSTAGLQVDPDHPTGTVEVSLAEGEPRFDIAADRAYDHIEVAGLPPLPAGGLLYHGTLALRQETSRATLQHIKQATGARIFVDVNLREPWWRRDTILAALVGASWVKLNRTELGRLAREPTELADQAAWLTAKLRLAALVITLGADGAALYRDGELTLAPSPGGPREVVDTVGAGDAFSSVVLLGLTRDWKWPVILQRAQMLAGAIVGLRGATTDDNLFYASIRRKWE